MIVEAAGFGIVSKLIVSKSEVVEAFAASFGLDAEDFGEKSDAELLFAAGV